MTGPGPAPEGRRDYLAEIRIEPRPDGAFDARAEVWVRNRRDTVRTGEADAVYPGSAIAGAIAEAMARLGTPARKPGT